MTDDPQICQPVEAIASQVFSSSQYRRICSDTVRRIAAEEWEKRSTSRLPAPQALQDSVAATYARLDQMYGDYESSIDYEQAYRTLAAAHATGDPEAVRSACRHLLTLHVSTRERLRVLDHLYQQVFALTGVPHVLLDLACGLNPLSLPWMGLGEGAVYYAYDLDVERVTFLNHCFALMGVPGGAVALDLITDVPAEEGDVALLLKSANCLEDQREGRTLELFHALRVRHIAVSFPPEGQQDGQRGAYNETFARILDACPWPVTRLDLEAEIIYVLDKGVAWSRAR